MKLFLVRNGETLWNHENRLQGHRDSPLTIDGKKQVQQLAELLKSQKIDVAYASDLGRAIDTSREILKLHPKVALIQRKELRERSHGIVEGLTQADVFKKYPKLQDERIKNKFLFKNPKGESYADTLERLKPFLDELRQKHFSQNVLLISHAAINRILMGICLNLSEEKILEIHQPHDCVYVIENADSSPSVSQITPSGVQAELFKRNPKQKPEFEEDDAGFDDE
ncbi:MAG: histidine phosphatase family protein [Candidatus Micrarchaeota archaeon]